MAGSIYAISSRAPFIDCCSVLCHFGNGTCVEENEGDGVNHLLTSKVPSVKGRMVFFYNFVENCLLQLLRNYLQLTVVEQEYLLTSLMTAFKFFNVNKCATTRMKTAIMPRDLYFTWILSFKTKMVTLIAQMDMREGIYWRVIHLEGNDKKMVGGNSNNIFKGILKRNAHIAKSAPKKVRLDRNPVYFCIKKVTYFENVEMGSPHFTSDDDDDDDDEEEEGEEEEEEETDGLIDMEMDYIVNTTMKLECNGEAASALKRTDVLEDLCFAGCVEQRPSLKRAGGLEDLDSAGSEERTSLKRATALRDLRAAGARAAAPWWKRIAPRLFKGQRDAPTAEGACFGWWRRVCLGRGDRNFGQRSVRAT